MVTQWCKQALCYWDAVLAYYECQGQSVTQHIATVIASHVGVIVGNAHEIFGGKKWKFLLFLKENRMWWYECNPAFLFIMYIFHSCCKTQLNCLHTQTTCNQLKTAAYWAWQKPNKDAIILDGLAIPFVIKSTIYIRLTFVNWKENHC